MNGSELSLGELIAGATIGVLISASMLFPSALVASWPVIAVVGGTVHYFATRWRHVAAGKDASSFCWLVCGLNPAFTVWALWPIMFPMLAVVGVLDRTQRRLDRAAQRIFARRQHPEREPGQLSEVPGESGQLSVPDKRPPGPGVKWGDL